MRITPSVTRTGTFSVYDGNTLADITAITINDGCSPYLVVLTTTGASGLTTSRAYELVTKTGGSGVAIFSAEL
jgi:hypothetical protein